MPQLPDIDAHLCYHFSHTNAPNLIGFAFLVILYVMNIILTIIAAIKANEGVTYRYPLTMRFIK